MKVLLIAAALLTTSLVFATPADAFGWCVDKVPGHDCRSHIACIGGNAGSPSTQPERCQYGVPYPRDPCSIIYCGPGPILP